VGGDGVARVARVDPTNETDQNVYAWAPDLSTGAAGYVSKVSAWGDRVAFIVGGVGVYVTEPTVLAASGWLTTSRIRFSTLEPKRARVCRVRLDSSFTKGQVSVAIGSDTDVTGASVAAVDQGVALDTGEVPIYVSDAGFYVLKFTLNRDAPSLPVNLSPCMSGYQLKVLPATFTPTRTVLPLLCMDEEETRTGSAVFRSALARLRALESLMKSGRVVRMQVLAPDVSHTLSELVVVEQVEYQQVTSPDDDTAFGGTLIVTTRSVA
jgi:hypothetical protein